MIISEHAKDLWLGRVDNPSVVSKFSVFENQYEEVSDSQRLCQTPLVSVCVVTYNHEKWIGDCLESILCQTCSFEFEVIVGEDCSTDTTRQVCLEYQRRYPEKIRLIVGAENVGCSSNYRRIIGNARGQFIAFCEGDDFWLTATRIEQQVKILQAQPAMQIIGARTRVYQSEKTNKDSRMKMPFFIPDGRSFAFSHISTWLTRRAVFGWVFEKNSEDYMRDIPIALHYQSNQAMMILNDEFSVYRPTGNGIWSSVAKQFKQYVIRKLEWQNYRSEYPLMCRFFTMGLFQLYVECQKEGWLKKDYSVFIAACGLMMQEMMSHPIIGAEYFLRKMWCECRCVIGKMKKQRR